MSADCWYRRVLLACDHRIPGLNSETWGTRFCSGIEIWATRQAKRLLSLTVPLIHGCDELRVALSLCLHQAVENAGTVAQHLTTMLLEDIGDELEPTVHVGLFVENQRLGQLTVSAVPVHEQQVINPEFLPVLRFGTERTGKRRIFRVLQFQGNGSRRKPDACGLLVGDLEAVVRSQKPKMFADSF